MAEAAVEDRVPSRFYCHLCNLRFEDASPNFTCPHCSAGFIEELQEPLEGNTNIDHTEVDDWEDDMDDLVTTLPLHLEEERRPGRTRHERGGRRTLTRLASNNLRHHVPFENLLQDFIVNLGVGVNWGTAGNMQLFLGNPGDYAWGREGLDAIVTQLLNQMDTTGPPPLSKNVIDALPIVLVNEQHISLKTQCSVCWEDFQLKEEVRQLPCSHIYHDPCIRPWLELHGTCPICRQNLVNSENASNGSNQHAGGTSNSGNGSLNVLRNLFNPHSNNSSGSTSGSLLDNSSPQTRSTSHSDSMM